MHLKKSTVFFESTLNSIQMANLLFMLFFCTLFIILATTLYNYKK